MVGGWKPGFIVRRPTNPGRRRPEVVRAVDTRLGRPVAIKFAHGTGRWLVLRGTLDVVGVAVLIGVPLALAITRFLSHMLYGLSPSDPWTLGVAVVMIAAAALIASCVPAIRAARLDAAVALRRG